MLRVILAVDVCQYYERVDDTARRTDSVIHCVQSVSTVSTQCPPAQRALDEYRLASASCTHRHCMIISRRLDRPTEHIRTRSAPNTALLMSKSDTGCVRSSRMLSHVRRHSADHTTVSEGTPQTGHTHCHWMSIQYDTPNVHRCRRQSIVHLCQSAESAEKWNASVSISTVVTFTARFCETFLCCIPAFVLHSANNRLAVSQLRSWQLNLC